MANYIEIMEPTTPKSRPNPQPQPTERKSRWWLWVVILGGVLGGIFFFTHRPGTSAESASAKGGKGAGGPVPVVAGTVKKMDVPIYLEGIGTIQALNTVTVHTRVDGQLEKVAFEEGQDVKAGDVLAVIDQAPFKAALAQAEGKLKQDQAQLNNAKLNYDRDADLVAKRVISQQDYDTQKNLVAQLEGTIGNDNAAVQSAQVNLNYTTVVAPLDGRTGIRLVDQGNIVHAADTTGLVVITELHPISLIFTLPEQSLTSIHKEETAGGKKLTVMAVDRDNKTKLDSGTLEVIDNQIDITTGTIKLKALFDNKDLMLWPGQFINAHLLVTTRKDGLVVPSSTIQRGPNGAYAFVIKEDQTVELRDLKVARKANGDIVQTEDGQALIDEGLAEGEKVVVDGQYKLQPGSKITVGTPGGKSGQPATGEKPGAHGQGHKHTSELK